jgi:hypothetical protein
VIPYKYDAVWYLSEGLVAVELYGRWGFIDRNDNLVIPCNYEAVWTFSEGLAPVKLNGKWGFIDKNDVMVISSKYDEAGIFSEGLARVKLNGKYDYIDKTGKLYTKDEVKQYKLAAMQSATKRQNMQPATIQQSANSQFITVTGIVYDDTEPLPGVGVVMKGTNLFTVTGVDGRFYIDVPNNSDAILVFSFLGFETKEIAVEDIKTSNIVIMLTPSSSGKRLKRR